MVSNTVPEPIHWRDRAIGAAEVISDGFDVVKAYGAHIANWVLFFCLIANLIEMVSPGFEAFAGLAVIGVQSISLDIAGFGLTAMAASAKRRGDEKSARKANGMGWTLITVMAITVGLITVSAFKKEWASSIQQVNQVLMFARVIVTVFYGHIVHQLREESTAHDKRVSNLEQQVSSLQKQVSTEQQQVSKLQGDLNTSKKENEHLRGQLNSVQNEVSKLRSHLSNEQATVFKLEQELSTGHGDTASLRRELNAALDDAENLRARLETKVHEVEVMNKDLSNVVNLRRELNSAQLALADLRGQLDIKDHELSSVQIALSNEQATVSKLQRELSNGQVFTGQQKRPNEQGNRSIGHRSKVSNEQSKVSNGQENILSLVSNGRDEDIKARIRKVRMEQPGISGRAIARALNISPGTALKYTGEIEQEDQRLVSNG